MLFTTETIKNEEFNAINNFFQNYDNEFSPVKTINAEKNLPETPVAKYISSLVCGQYAKAVEDIENTKIGNKIKRRKNLQQVMQESFFYGANRFGNNFIA